MIREETVQKIRSENEIVDVITENGVKLKRTGRNYIGLCPFHSEKSPSFSVSSEKQIYKCFGCGEAGNVITFLMKTKNLSYIESLKQLAERANIEIEDDDKNKGKNLKFEKLIKINTEAARYFFSNLMSNKIVSEYFINRGININTVKKFGLGFALDDWSGLYRYLISKGCERKDLIEIGLIVEGKNNSYYDRFRNRVMFPVFDYKGRVIGFGGRVLDDSKPKYLNSSESEIFNKGTNLYGLNFSIKNGLKDYVIIVEGYMDVIALHQYGITNVVASLGTALTLGQAKLIKRYVNKVIISFDADFAGQNATLRGLKVLGDVGFEVRVLKVPEGKDPDDYIRRNGKESFLKLVDSAKEFVDYIISFFEGKYDLKNQEQKISYVKDVCEVIKELDSIKRDVHIKRISEKTNISEQAIYELINDTRENSKIINQNMNNQDEVGYKLYLEQGFIKAEKAILKLMHLNNVYYEYIIERVKEEYFTQKEHIKLFNIIKSLIDLEIGDREGKIENSCNDADVIKAWINIKDENFNENGYEVERLIDDYIYVVKKNCLENKINYISEKIKNFERNGKVSEALELLKEQNDVQSHLKKLIIDMRGG